MIPRQNTNSLLFPAYVLHTRPYKDTSLLVDLFTEQSGRITVVAKGAKRAKSKMQGLLLPFVQIIVSFSGKTDLYSLNNVEANGLPHFLKGDQLLSGFYLNELLYRLLHSGDPHPKLYAEYRRALQGLVNSSSKTHKFAYELVLRIFEKCLLQEVGYGLQLNIASNGLAVDEESFYIFSFGEGFSKLADDDFALLSEDHKHGVFSGKSLLALHNDQLLAPEEFRDAKRLLRIALEVMLNNRAIKSRELFY